MKKIFKVAEHWLESGRQARQAVRDFVDGAASGDLERMERSLENLSYGHHEGGGLKRAFRQVAKLPSIPRITKKWFLQLHLIDGTRIRGDTGDDLIYFLGLRALLPRYRGPAVRLYRGDSAQNRRRRTYGPAWSSSEQVARGFAETGLCRASEGGSVLLVTKAPRRAILCAPALSADDYAEKEYVVDRRFLHAVDVVERFSQFTTAELNQLTSRISAT